MRFRRLWMWGVLIGAAGGLCLLVPRFQVAREKSRVLDAYYQNGYTGMAAGPAAVEAPGGLPVGMSGATRRSAQLRPSAAPAAVTLTAIAESRPDRYLIKNATLTVETRDVRRAAESLVTAAQAAGGYVSESSEAVDGLGRRSMSVQVRLPFGRFDTAMRQIEALGRVTEKEVTAEDVTEEFVDSHAKLRNLQRTEARLLEHLNRTGRLADTLLVEKELNRVRGEIEQLEGRLRFLQNRVAYSTLAVTLREAPGAEPTLPAASFSSGQVASSAVRALVIFSRLVWSIAIWLGVWAVVWAPVAVAVGLSYRRKQRAAQFHDAV